MSTLESNKGSDRTLIQRSAFWSILVMVLVIHLRMILEDPVLARDDQWIISNVKDWAFYREEFSQGNWLAPIIHSVIRDMTLTLDLWIEAQTGISVFHLGNIVVFVFILAQIKFIFEREIKDRLVAQVAWIAFAIHPVANISVLWISGRKHLLAFLFILCAVRALITRRHFLWTALFYILSLASHPIFVLFPIWAFFTQTKGQGEKIKKLLSGSLVLVALILGLSIYVHYTSTYENYFQNSKVLNAYEIGTDSGVLLLSLGRYFYNVIAPYQLYVTYYPGAWPNIVGFFLLLITLGVTYLFREKLRDLRFSWALFGGLPIALFLLFPTQIFVSDTYSLALVFSVVLLLGQWASSHFFRRTFRAGIILVLCSWMIMSVDQSEVWSSDITLWDRALEREKSPTVLTSYAVQALENHRPEFAKPYISMLLNWDPDHPYTKFLFLKLIYEEKSLTYKQKRKLFLKNRIDSPWHSYYLAHTLAGLGDKKNALKLLECAAAQNPHEWDMDAATIAAEMTILCEKIGKRKNCDDIAQSLKSSSKFNWKDYFRKARGK